MSLTGTLDTLSLPELCHLLAGTAKTGALHVRGDVGQGVLWFTAGKVCAGEAGGQTGPAADGDALLPRLHDVCFELFRIAEGGFEFEPDRRPSWRADRGVDVAGLLAETDRRMAEWQEIIAVIPSVEARPRLVPEPPAAGPITLDAAQWRVVTGIDGRRRVSALIRVLDGGEFTVCKVLRSLVDAGLVEIEAAEPVAADGLGATAAAEPVAALPAKLGRGPVRSDTDALAPPPEPVPEDPLADGLDRGAVVALLTSARSK